MSDFSRGAAFLLLFLSLPSLGGCRDRPNSQSGARDSFVVEKTFQIKFSDSPHDKETVPYCLLAFRPPTPEERYPLLFIWHGNKDTALPYLEIWRPEAERRKWMVLAPDRSLALRSETHEMAIFDELLKEIERRYPVDQEKIFVAGTSTGALVAQWALLHYPSVVKGAIFVTAADYRRLSSEDHLGILPPVLFVHGEKDQLFESILSEVSLLKNRGIRATLLRYPGAGHEHRPEWNGKIFDWIEAEAYS